MAHGVPLTADAISATTSSCWSAWTSARRVYRAVRSRPRSPHAPPRDALGLELVNNGPVLYREGDVIERVSRDRFAELAASSTVSPNTRVFDNTLTRVGDLLAGKWEVKAADAWHARAFF